MTLLKVDDLDVRIGGTKLLDKVSFAVGKAQRFGIIGESGAGKSISRWPSWDCCPTPPKSPAR